MLKIRVNKDNRLELRDGHFYNPRCKCTDCTETWLGIACGEIQIMSHDGKQRMVGSFQKRVDNPV